jgi:hypothetical protein
VRFDWIAWQKALHYTVKDEQGTVIGAGMIPARSSPYGVSWITSDHVSRISGDRAATEV